MNKILVAIVAIIVVVGAVFLLSNNANKTSTNPTASDTQTQTTTSPTEAMQEQATTSGTVNLTASGFTPQTITVKVGTKVVWTNKSGQMGNVNSVPHPTHTAYPPLNLGNFASGQNVSLVFDKVGSYGYHNHLDASQTGTVAVEQ